MPRVWRLSFGLLEACTGPLTARWRAVFISMALVAAGCGPGRPLSTETSINTTGTTGTTAPTASTDDPSPGSTNATTGATAACTCTAFMEAVGGCTEDNVWMHVPECPLAVICPTLTVRCPRPNEDLYDCHSELVFDEEAMTCALTAMRDRTPGRFIVEGTEAGLFYFGTLYGMRLRGDDVAVVTECRSGEGTGWSAGNRILAPPAYFTDCLAKPTAFGRHACLLKGLQDPVLLPACVGDGS